MPRIVGSGMNTAMTVQHTTHATITIWLPDMFRPKAGLLLLVPDADFADEFDEAEEFCFRIRDIGSLKHA